MASACQFTSGNRIWGFDSLIFVTVGTSSFDPLIEAIDHQVETGLIADSVVAQIGRGRYEPSHIRYFRFIRSLDSAYERADVIISTGGAGTTLECVTRGLRLVSVENTTLMEGHQSELISELESKGHLIWCRDLGNLHTIIEKAKKKTFIPFKPEPPTVHLSILEYLS
ncbi:MAG: hypothetical protein GF411_16350 [Candidatus Lokiarchaeota archaeon]|nr:hypothetical protein [Candidatus Lokiarchaeota archaeon]